MAQIVDKGDLIKVIKDNGDISLYDKVSDSVYLEARVSGGSFQILRNGNVLEDLGSYETFSSPLTSSFNALIDAVIGIIYSTSGETNIIEVTSGSDLPSVLENNTAYKIKGRITVANSITAGQDNLIYGDDSILSTLEYTGTGPFITIVSKNFTARNLEIKTVSGTIFNATDIDYTINPIVDGFQGRGRRLQIINCRLTGAGYNTPSSTSTIGEIEGFGTVNFNANLITGWNQGLSVSNCLSFEGLNNKSVLWGQSTGSKMINFRDNNWSGQTGAAGSYIPTGMNVMNCSGNTFHPRTIEIGIYWDGTSATVVSGNISGNIFLISGLTTGALFSGATYNQIPSINIQGNQGISDNTAYSELNLNSFGSNTTIGAVDTPVQVDGGTSFTNPHSQLFTFSNTGTATYIGKKEQMLTLIASITFEPASGNNKIFSFYFAKNGSVITHCRSKAETDTGVPLEVSVSCIDEAEENDVFSIWVENNSDAVDVLVSDISVTLKE